MKKIGLNSLESRVTAVSDKQLSSIMRAFSIVSPQLVYFYLNFAVIYGFALYYKDRTSPSVAVTFRIRLLALVLAVLPLLYSFYKENPVIIGKALKKPNRIFKTIVLALSAALFFNILFAVTGIIGSSEEYGEAAASLYSLPFGAGLFLYGVVTPIAEEIVNRGLIYNRARRFFNLPFAVIVSALIFGASHGNIVQLLYGFIMGVLICVVYEHYGAFIYPVLFHAAANSFVYILTYIKSVARITNTVPGFVLSGIITTALIMYIFMEEDTAQIIDTKQL